MMPTSGWSGVGEQHGNPHMPGRRNDQYKNPTGKMALPGIRRRHRQTGHPGPAISQKAGELG
jgi:hypothetical protein